MCSSIYCDDCIFNIDDECRLNQIPADYNWKYTDWSKNDQNMYLFRKIQNICFDSVCRTCQLHNLNGECSMSTIPLKFIRNWTKVNGRA